MGRRVGFRRRDSQENLSADDVLSVSFVEMTKNEMIDSLTRFTLDTRVVNLLGLTEGKTPLNLDTFDAGLDRLRTDLVTLLKEEDLKRKEKAKNNKPLADAVYNILLNLAKQKPINTEDFQTLEEIPEDTRVFVSTGHHFDIRNLIQFHATRDHRGRILGETPTSKYLLNVGTNAPFSERDTLHIQHVAGEKGIIIPDLNSHEYADPVRRPEEVNHQQVLVQRALARLGDQQTWLEQIDVLAPPSVPSARHTTDQGRFFDYITRGQAVLRNLDEPIRNLLQMRNLQDLEYLIASNISLEQLMALYARDPAFLDETLTNASTITQLVYRAFIPLEVFFNFEHDLRFRFYTCREYLQLVRTLVVGGHVPGDQLTNLSAHSQDFYPFMRQLTHDRCLGALREGSTTLESLVSMSPEELRIANETGDYPSPAPRPRPRQ